MWALWTIPLLLLFFGAMIWQVVRRGYQMKDLVERGKPVTGEVVKKIKFRGASSTRKLYLRYRFQAGDGKDYSHKIAVGIDDYEAYEPGQSIELIYLPDNPKVSARVEMVEIVREAMQKRADKIAKKKA